MKKNCKIICCLFFVLFILGGVLLYRYLDEQSRIYYQANYLCEGNKTIRVVLFITSKHPFSINIGKVKVILDNGKKITLHKISKNNELNQYANRNKTFILKEENKYSIEILEKNNKSRCIILSDDNGNLPNTYLDPDIGFTVRYPKNFKIDTSYKYQLSPDKEIKGVKFILVQPQSVSDPYADSGTGVSIETIPDTDNCSADLFFDTKVESKLRDFVINIKITLTNDEVNYCPTRLFTFSVASRIKKVDNHYYYEKVYALPGTNPCIGIRYFIHSIDYSYNFEKEGTISRIYKNSINYYSNEFEKIKDSFISKDFYGNIDVIRCIRTSKPPLPDNLSDIFKKYKYISIFIRFYSSLYLLFSSPPLFLSSSFYVGLIIFIILLYFYYFYV